MLAVDQNLPRHSRRVPTKNRGWKKPMSKKVPDPYFLVWTDWFRYKVNQVVRNSHRSERLGLAILCTLEQQLILFLAGKATRGQYNKANTTRTGQIVCIFRVLIKWHCHHSAVPAATSVVNNGTEEARSSRSGTSWQNCRLADFQLGGSR